LIPIVDQSTSYFLEPVGIFDPSEFITAESQRIPFKASLLKPHEWQEGFKNWPLPPIAGWRNWYKRVLDDDSVKTSNWDSLRIAHCLELSLAETPKNENLLIAACHFWSNGANAFLFGHGPMSPTLADVYIIIGLGVIGTIYPHKYQGSSRQTGVRTGVGYKKYIQNYMFDGPLSDVELLLTSIIGTSLQPTTRKVKPRAPKVAKLVEKLPPLCSSIKALANFLSSSSEVLPILVGFHIWTMTT
jgi:hypothetical protein